MRVDAAPDFNVEQVVSRLGSRTTSRATRHGEGYVAGVSFMQILNHGDNNQQLGCVWHVTPMIMTCHES